MRSVLETARAWAGAGARPAHADEKDGLEDRGARSLGMLQNSLALIAAKVGLMGLGFVFWLVAARAFDTRAVGLAAGAVSAVMLCTQLALLGIGSAFITFLPEHRREPARLVDTAITMVSIASVLVALLFLVVSRRFLQQLSVMADDPLFRLSFVVVGVVGTLGILLDQISTALRRGDQAVVRNVLSGGITLAHLVGLAFFLRAPSAIGLFGTWVTGGFAGVLVGYVQLKRCISGYRYRPNIQRKLRKALLGAGIPNHLLTLTERAPGFVLPIAVTELLSPTDNAHWYAAWMMAWVVYIIPIQVGMTLFAETRDDPQALARYVLRGIKTSLALGVVGACGAAIVAPAALALLGHGYSASATAPLRILLVGVIPLTLIQAYFAICRSTRRLREAIIVGTAGALTGTAAAMVGGWEAGLVGMASAWVIIQSATAVWSVVRLRSLLRRLGAKAVANVDVSTVPPLTPGFEL